MAHSSDNARRAARSGWIDAGGAGVAKKIVVGCLIALTVSAARADTLTLDVASGCRFLPPADWPARVNWIGDCRDGLAEGLGVLKASEVGEVVAFFFGRMEHGRPSEGALEGGGGRMAGRFVDGRIAVGGDRNDLIRAFDVAGAGAEAAAALFARMGNQPSSDFYRRKARQMREQMD